MTHTPLPWTAIWGGRYIVPVDHEARPIGAADNDDTNRDRYAQQICTLRDDRHGRGTADANAAFIVKACNMHEELVAALDDLLDSADLSGRRTARIEFAKSVLAKAREATP